MENLFTIKDLVEEIASNQDMAIAIHSKCRVLSFDKNENADKETYVLKMANTKGHTISVWFNFETKDTAIAYNGDSAEEALAKDQTAKLKHLINLVIAMGLQKTLLSLDEAPNFVRDFMTLRGIILDNKMGNYFNLKVIANGAGNPKISKSGWKCYEKWEEGKEPTLTYTADEKNKINNLSMNTNSPIINADGEGGLGSFLV